MYKFENIKGDVFITSDEHYGHYNIIRMCERPYDNIEEMNQSLIDNHNSIVGIFDITIHLGDFIWKCVGFDDIVYQLNGTHIFIKGNHDKSYPSQEYAHIHRHKYSIRENQIFEFEYLKRRFVACHYPMVEWNGSFHNSIHLYGHTHRDLNYAVNSYHVGVDTNEWKPINLKTI